MGYVQPAPVVKYGTLAPACETSCCMVSQSFQEVFNVAWKLENTVPPVIALSFHSSATEDVDHEALWLRL